MPLALPQGRASATSHYCSIRNQPVLRHDDDAITDVIHSIWTVCLFRSRLIQQSHVGSDARILVYDRASNHSSFTDAHARTTRLAIAKHVFQTLVVIRAHHV